MPKPTSTPAERRRLKRVEELLRTAGYNVRYERGHFRAGACLVHERRVVVVNRFFDASARERALRDLTLTLEIDPAQLADEQDRALLSDIVSRAATPAG